MAGWVARTAGHTGLLPACALLAALASPAAAQITGLSLESQIDGPSAPFLVALDKGYYRAEGLNISVQGAVNSAESLKRVADGDDEFGFSDINALIRYRDADPTAPVKAIFVVYNRPPFAVIGRKSRGIMVPKNLEGKTLGAPANDDAFAIWPIFAQIAGIDTGKVSVESVGRPVREPMLAAGQIDAIIGRSFAQFVNLKERGVPADDLVVMLMADFGVALYGNVITVNTKFAAEHPDKVKGFLHAFVRGLKDTMKAPDSAIESVIKRSENAKKPVELERLKIAISDNILTPEVKAAGFGDIDPGRFAQAIEQFALGYRFRNGRPKLEDIFDGSFLPPVQERRVN